MNKNVNGIGFIKNLLSFSVSTWVSFIISFFATPIITRMFVPEEMGKINLFMTYESLAIIICYFGFDQTYVRFFNEPPGKHTKNEVLGFSLKISTVATAVVAVIILLCHNYFSIKVSGEAGMFIPVCFVTVLFSDMLLRYSNLHYRMSQKALLFSIQSIILTLIKKVLYVAAAFVNPTYKYAIFAFTVAFFVTAFIFLFININKNVQRSKFNALEKRDMFRYAIPIIPVSLLAILNVSAPTLMLREYVDYASIGIYSSAVSICSVISLLQAGFNTYWTPFVFENYKTQNEKIKKIHRYIVFLMVAFGICIVLFQDLLYLLLGAKYRASKNIFAILLLSPICYTIAETTGVGINISKKTYLSIITSACSIISNFLIGYFLIPRLSILGAAISTAISAVIMLVVRTIIGERFYKCVDNYFKSFSPIAIMAAVACVNYFFIDKYIIKYALVICLGILLIGIYYKEFISLCKIAFNMLEAVFNSKKTKKEG